MKYLWVFSLDSVSFCIISATVPLGWVSNSVNEFNYLTPCRTHVPKAIKHKTKLIFYKGRKRRRWRLFFFSFLNLWLTTDLITTQSRGPSAVQYIFKQIRRKLTSFLHWKHCRLNLLKNNHIACSVPPTKCQNTSYSSCKSGVLKK